MISVSCNYQITSPYNQVKQNSSKPIFGSNYDVVHDIFTGKTFTPNATSFFRNDLKWGQLTRFVFRHFKKSNKLNIVCVPCADGSEPVSLLLKFAQKRGFEKFLDKFKVIKAYDINQKMIDTAKSGEIPIINSFENGIWDFLRLSLHARKGVNKDYFIKNGKLVLSEPLKKHIEYDRKDILTVLNNLTKDEDTVLMARNIFPYLDDVTLEIIKKPLSRLKKGSLLVVGNFDKENIPKFDKIIRALGYQKTLVRNCYRKVS